MPYHMMSDIVGISCGSSRANNGRALNDRLAIIWTNADFLPIGPLETTFN